jgi:hypothetical protein
MRRFISDLSGLLTVVFIVTPWLAGIVLAKGFWSVTFSILFFPYAYYLVVEKVLTIWGWV